MGVSYKGIFNGLSKWSRFKLKSAALTEVFSDVLKKDTEKRPWMYPIYAGSMVVIVVPFLGAGTVLMAGVAGWVGLRLTPWARSVHDSIKSAFNAEALIDKFKDHIEPAPLEPDRYQVKGLSMAWSTTKKVYADIREATGIACQSFKRFICS
jgi:hypothetical protein